MEPIVRSVFDFPFHRVFNHNNSIIKMILQVSDLLFVDCNNNKITLTFCSQNLCYLKLFPKFVFYELILTYKQDGKISAIYPN